MNFKKSNLLIFISFFPVFIFRSNLDIIEIIYTLLIFIIPILLINFIIFKKKLFNNIFFKFYLSIIIVYGIDNQLGLWSGAILPFKQELLDIFGLIYTPGLILFVFLLLLIHSLALMGKDKFYTVITVFLCVIFLFGIFDQTKSHKKIKNYVKESNNLYQKTKIIMVFDEMSGLKSFESSNYNGSLFTTYAMEFFEKHNFEFYSDVESFTKNTAVSLSAMINFSEKSIKEKAIKRSTNFYFEHEITKNLLFEKYNNIGVYQSIHLDFCKPENVTKCNSYSPFVQNEYLNGFKDTYLTKIISIWKLNGSIVSAIVWRSLREFRIIDSTLEPEGHKTSFQNLFKSLENDIYSKKYDLIFVHTLVPHRPYGFDSKCNYDGSLSLRNRYYSTSQHVKQHNIGRKCTLIYIDAFLENLKKNNFIDLIDLTILSDHGARILKTRDSSLSSIYARKNSKTRFKEIKDKVIFQSLFINEFK